MAQVAGVEAVELRGGRAKDAAFAILLTPEPGDLLAALVEVQTGQSVQFLF
jgi:hypothetical protein